MTEGEGEGRRRRRRRGGGGGDRPPQQERQPQQQQQQPRPQQQQQPRPQPQQPRLIDERPREPEHDDSGEHETRFVPEPEDSGPAPAIQLAADLPEDAPANDPDRATHHLLALAGDGAAALAQELGNVVAIKFSTASKLIPHDAGDQRYARGERVIVDTDRGPRLATVASASARLPSRDRQLRRVLRRAHDGDLRAEAQAATQGEGHLRVAKELVRKLDLPIKVFRVEVAPGRLFVYYASEDRVELRELLRELGTATGRRIELRQIGARDEAKMVGGIGSCGQELCCTTWLPEFVPVSIKMAKDQGLVLNPSKVAGQCGRLKCCLVYEQATYAEMRKGLPKLGKRVVTAHGEGRVVEVDVLRQRIRVATGPGESHVLAPDEVKPLFPAQQGGRPHTEEPDEPEDDLPDGPEDPTRAPS